LITLLDIQGINIVEVFLEAKKREEKVRRASLSQEERDAEDAAEKASRQKAEKAWEEKEKAEAASVAADRAQLRLVVAVESKRASIKKMLQDVGVINVEFSDVYAAEDAEKFRGVLITNPTEEMVFCKLEVLGFTKKTFMAKNYFWHLRQEDILPEYIYLKGDEVTFVYYFRERMEIVHFKDGRYWDSESSYEPDGVKFSYWSIVF